MHIPDMPFEMTDWSEVPAVDRPGVTGVARWHTRQMGEIRVSMVEYAAGYRSPSNTAFDAVGVLPGWVRRWIKPQGGVAMPRDPVIANQKKILANQERILANQRRIEGNQSKLDRVLANQKRILANQRRILAKK